MKLGADQSLGDQNGAVACATIETPDGFRREGRGEGGGSEGRLADQYKDMMLDEHVNVHAVSVC